VKVEDGFGMETADEAVGYEDALATILFTSGSTGFSKGVEYTHTQLVASSRLKSTFHHMDSSKTFMSWVSKY
jgi:long-subunit acyl-CoA synthetase (AMP-forming)